MGDLDLLLLWLLTTPLEDFLIQLRHRHTHKHTHREGMLDYRPTEVDRMLKYIIRKCYGC